VDLIGDVLQLKDGHQIGCKDGVDELEQKETCEECAEECLGSNENDDE